MGLVDRYYQEGIFQRLNQTLGGIEGMLSHSCGNIVLQFCCACIFRSQSTGNNIVARSYRGMW